jgi:hypothetical protein
MAPPRRVRDEVLALRRPGLPDIELFRARESIYSDQYPTQGRFQVSPNAQVIAFTMPGQNTLSLARRDGTLTSFDGVHHDQFRISPDSQSLSVARYYGGTYGMSRIDLRTMQHASYAEIPQNIMSWSEYCAEGLVVLGFSYVKTGRQNSLELMPGNEQPRTLTLLDMNVRRFACAKAGTSIAYFAGGKVWSIPKAGAEPVLLADLDEEIVNAEMAPDGRSLVVVTNKDAYVFEDGKLAVSLGIPQAHTVWFSRDGSQFVVANAHMAHWQRGTKTAKLTADEKSPIRSARFAPLSPWVMVARGQDAVRWNPDQDEAETIASVDADQEMLGVDVFAGGVVLWTGTIWQVEVRSKHLD